MSRTTAQLRRLWAPACAGKEDVFLHAYVALDEVMHKHGYRPRAGVTGAYNCRKITGGSGYSLHAYGPGSRFVFWTKVAVTTAVAVDVNWDRNPYGPHLVTDMPRAMVDEVCAIETVDGVIVWRWGGYYETNKDAMHFEIVASPAELKRGIAGASQEEVHDVFYMWKDPEDGKTKLLQVVTIPGKGAKSLWVGKGKAGSDRKKALENAGVKVITDPVRVKELVSVFPYTTTG
jgi:hypothetical protein